MRVGLLGRTDWLLATAEALAAAGHRIAFVQTCPAEPHYTAGEADFAALAARHGAPYLSNGSIRRSDPFRAAAGAEVCVSLNWPTLIPEAAMAAFPHGILNAHAGDLPRYRGNACPNWAILNFESHVGLTIHRMTAELDAGPWLCQTRLPIDETTYVGDIYDWLATAIPAAFVAALDRLATDGYRPQDPAVRPLRAFPRRPEDARIDWRAPVRQVLALVRASSRPFDGAFTLLEGHETIRIFRARPYLPDFDYLAVPGQVCLSAGGNPVIAAGDGMAEIEDCASAAGGHPDTSRLILKSLRHRLV